MSTLRQLVVLTLLFSKSKPTTGLSPIKLTFCPIDVCECLRNEETKETIIDCRDKGLTSVPYITPTDETYQEITFSDSNPSCRDNIPPSCSNRITEIHSNAFAGLKVHKINFETNILRSVDNNAFAGLEAVLSELILEGDGNSFVPLASVRNLKNLKLLHLEHFTVENNGITNLPQDFPNLETLVLQSLQLQFIAEGSVTGKLGNLKRLEILNNPDFVSYPVSALRQLTTLEHVRFIQNGIETLPSVGNAFHKHLNLTELDLSHNYLHTLQPGCFNHLENRLAYLGLHLNYLNPSRLGPIRDGNWQNLEQLILDSNDFSTGIPTNLFQRMPKLANLNLQLVNLPVIKAGDFSGLTNLLFLHLSGNPLTQIQPGTFSTTPNLQGLYLDDVGIINNKLLFSSETAAGLSNLQRLELSRAHIQPDPFWKSLPSMPNLSHLLISETGLSVIPDLAFQYNTKLQTIEMKSNSLTQLTQAQIHGPGNSLKSLDLSLNAITLIDNCAVEEWENSLNDLYMGGNPLHCDCKILGLYNWAKKRQLVDPFFKYLFQGRCINKDNRELISLDRNDLNCSDERQFDQCHVLTTSVPATSTNPPDNRTQPLPVLTVSIARIDSHNITVSWTVQGTADEFYITVQTLDNTQILNTIRVHSDTRERILQIGNDHNYRICVYARTENKYTVPVCKELTRQTVSKLPSNESLQSPLSSGQIALISTGSCVGIILIIMFILISLQWKICTKVKESTQGKTISCEINIDPDPNTDDNATKPTLEDSVNNLNIISEPRYDTLSQYLNTQNQNILLEKHPSKEINIV